MDKNLEYWIEKAHVYTVEHPAVESVGEIQLIRENEYHFIARFNVNLPGRFSDKGESAKGVRAIEPVEFIFNEEFPYKAPKIYLRDDFCREFPHINPSKRKVFPCIFEGSLDELLQQPKWFDLILDQVMDWLEKAAADDLMNSDQGWEPMRTDSLGGLICYDFNAVAKRSEYEHKTLTANILCKSLNDKIYSLLPPSHTLPITKSDVTKIIFFRNQPGDICDRYIPINIEDFTSLCNLAKIFKIISFKETVNKTVSNMFGKTKKNKKYVLVSFCLTRPFNVIGTSSDREIINFAIKLDFQKRNKKIHQNAKVYILAQHEINNPELFRRFSGVNQTYSSPIVQIGCGSLGSKICLHLARNGNDNFKLIDDDFFSPHNNARHALVDGSFLGCKAEILSDALQVLRVKSEPIVGDAKKIIETISKRSLFIDSTADLTVRNFIATANICGSVIHTALYNHGKLAVLLTESENRNPRLDDLVARLYSECLTEENFRDNFLKEQKVGVNTGLGCGSSTVIASDSRISLSSAGISERIQQYFDRGIPESGEILIGSICDGELGMRWNQIPLNPVKELSQKTKEGWSVRVFEKVINEMKRSSEQDLPNETGGVLLGYISTINQTVTITDLISAPEDSIKQPHYFQLSTTNLKSKVRKVEKKTNGMLTYIGTWHSHPTHSAASPLDKKTYEYLSSIRNSEPTVCLICTPKDILLLE